MHYIFFFPSNFHCRALCSLFHLRLFYLYKAFVLIKPKIFIAGPELYEKLKTYILSEKELRENHFPRPDCVGRAKFYLSDITKDPYLPSKSNFSISKFFNYLKCLLYFEILKI